MTFQGDPYRTLGVAPGASLNELKSAYRRLVKKYHPDAAGERALPRFLAIQAAYETLVDGEGRLRPPGSPQGRPGSGGGAAPGGQPWRADPGRARASRDAWRARRSGSGGTAGYRPSDGGAGGRGSPRPGAAGDGGPGSGSGTGAGAGTGAGKGDEPGSGAGAGSGPGAGAGPSRPRGTGERHHRRGRRTATPGSTTYDEAAETPLDPEWDGGAWYGPSSGTYWTLNPREYADPRKHGPEYLARARRAATDASTPGADTGDAGDGPADGADDPDGPAADGWEWTGTAETRTSGSTGAWRARAWTYEAAPGDGTAWTPGHEGGPSRPPRPDRWSSPPGADGAGAFPDLEALARRAFPESLLALARHPDPRWRLLLALIAWPPIGYALGGLVGTVTGCARYSASCPEATQVLVFAAQPFIVGGLFLVPPVAAVAAFAALAAVAMALPAGAVLAVGALPRPVIEPLVLGVIVALTYGVAWIAAIVRLWGPARVRHKDAGRGP